MSFISFNSCSLNHSNIFINTNWSYHCWNRYLAITTLRRHSSSVCRTYSHFITDDFLDLEISYNTEVNGVMRKTMIHDI
ncbi:unnamed protein product [Lupinus luteus]|uniref:Uncharacterized protein n=1 Tax=Lupinus luteus TaxID=3873 RepID=A0AAV1YBD1_LUPLU